VAKGKALAATIASVVALFGWYEWLLNTYLVPTFNRTPQVAQGNTQYLLLGFWFTLMAVILWILVVHDIISGS
jgi:hypothetical protein